MTNVWTWDSAPGTRARRTSASPEVVLGGLRLRPRWRIRRVALLCAFAFVACALIPAALSTLLPPVYGAQAELLLKPRPDLSDGAAERVMLSEEVILKSPAVLGPVATQSGVSLESLQSAVTTSMAGRSNVLRLTVADRDPTRALSLLRAIQREYAAIHALNLNVDPASPDRPTLTYTSLTAPHLLDDPLAPRPLRFLAAGTLVGILVSVGVAVLLLRPLMATGRPSQE